VFDYIEFEIFLHVNLAKEGVAPVFCLPLAKLLCKFWERGLETPLITVTSTHLSTLLPAVFQIIEEHISSPSFKVDDYSANHY